MDMLLPNIVPCCITLGNMMSVKVYEDIPLFAPPSDITPALHVL